MFILVRRGIRKFNNYKLQVITLLVGTVIPFIGNLLYVFNIIPIIGTDLIPFYFVVTGLLYALIIFPFGFLDVIPIALNALVEDLPDGFLVLSGDVIWPISILLLKGC